MIMEYHGIRPDVEKAAFVAENASIIGDVQLEEGSSVWFGAVLRGDEGGIRIGKNTNVQDNTVVHMDAGDMVIVGDNVTIGHTCIIHGCTIGDNSLIGMGATVMNGAKIGKNCLVGAGALVTEGKEFPDGSLIIGSPAVLKAALSEETIKGMQHNVDVYVEIAKEYQA